MIPYENDPDYQRYLADCAKHCRCTFTLCGGVLAGGLCEENIQYDEFPDEEYYYDWCEEWEQPDDD